MGVQMFSCAFLILVLFFSNVMFCINLPFVSGQCDQSQKDLLLELKNNLTYNSSHSTKLVQWNESSDCCQWRGVKCDPRGRVTGLDLSSESISAGIDDNTGSLLRLEFLQSLNLAHNRFNYVQFPSAFGQLAGLRYLNLSNSQFSGQIPAELSNLTRLVVLDLSSGLSDFPLNLENPDLIKLLQNFTQIRELYLDGVNISANGYQWCNAISSYLPDLRVLSLSNTYITGPFHPSLAKLQSLSVIRLNDNLFSSPFPEFFADFPFLRDLTMSSCNLSGVTPAKLFQKTSLQTIDLSGNEFLEGSLPEFTMNLSLQNLLLRRTNFSGNVHESIGNLKMLSQIHLNNCHFSGSIPNSFRNLTELTELNLSGNRFIGHVPSFAFLKNLTSIDLGGNGLTGQISDSHWEGLENLVSLGLYGNSLEGEIPTSLSVLPSLKLLNLNNNRFYGPIRRVTNSSSYSMLQVLDLSVNNFEGPIPPILFGLHNLSSLWLSRNRFNGSVDLADFRVLSKLRSLDLSYNNLSVFINENVSLSSLLPRLGRLELASCKLPKFPPLQNYSSLAMLDLSYNKLHGEIPNWIWEVGNGFFNSLNLSHNQFTSLQEPYNLGSLQFLDLHSNMLGGKIPVPPPSAALVDFSNNKFSGPLPENIGNSLSFAFFFSIANNNISGTIPPSLCNASYIEVLDLSNNSLHGGIPSCLVSAVPKVVLNLRRNNLSGDIPDTFPVACGLETLDLSWNGLQGQVPISLSRCSNIKVLNLGHNKLNDAFPCSFENLSELRVLELRSNNFYGNISCLQANNYTWPNLQIVNLASNNFHGILPGNLFQKMRALIVDNKGTQAQLDHLHFASVMMSNVYYQDSVTVTISGQEHELDKILTVFTSIDFSNNHFEGVIPETIGELKSLYILNFSHNAFFGHMPSTVGKLEALGSFDLSFNQLGGEIPNQLANIPRLSFLNLSYNELIGRIPRGNQMDSFREDSYLGNDGLCGFPLNINCNDVMAPEIPQRKSGEEHDSFGSSDVYISAALGFLVGLGVIFMPLLFSRRWSKFYNKHINKFVLVVLHGNDRRLEKEDW